MQVQAHQAATKYERAMSMQTAAREMVELAEQGYESKKPTFDMAWQEMLNHATMKVGETSWLVECRWLTS